MPNADSNLSQKIMTSIQTKEKFGEIYSSKFWLSEETKSGAGSEIKHTRKLVSQLSLLIAELNIESIVDCPCGDMNWQSDLLRSPLIRYVGLDIVPELISENLEKDWSRYEISPTFLVGDLIENELPPCDFLMVRDCLVHLPQELVLQALRNLSSQNAYLIGITSFFGVDRANYDIEIGEWRPLNLSEYPYGLPFPKRILVEECEEGLGEFSDKTLAIWTIQQLRDWAEERFR
jgi:hypothetical protein